ncbi:MAG: molybdopterin molybdotransferase MoeA [Selenomonadaceae bacterium]|nr:molybdopterin molybdotransferase MoeA [Selenomonadaceae bacterium]
MEGITLERAIEILTANVKPIDEPEEVSLIESVGRVAAQNYFATFDNPPFDRSPLDGYALKSSDTTAPIKLKVIGEECAGDFFAGEIKSGEALRIMTGAAMPKGSDCVIRQEDVTFDGENIFVKQQLKHHENYCFAGEDIKAGALLVEKNSVLTAAHVAVLASQGVAAVKVYRRARIAIASTGDELIQPGEKISAGKIYNSNLYLLASRLIELGFAPKILYNLPDDADACADKIFSLREEIDLLITTGGVSVGKKDIMHDVIKKIGEKLFWRVLMKPGAPVVGWTCGKFLGVALSGNPFAAYATFELLTRPVMAKLARRADILYNRSRGVLADNFPKKSFGRRFIRARFDGEKIFLPNRHESGALYSAVGCNAFIDIPAGSDELAAGMEVEMILL